MLEGRIVKIIEKVEMNVVTDVLCDRCLGTTRVEGGLQFGTLTARWGFGSQHDGEVYELHLCEVCFFLQVSAIKRERWTQVMFTAEGDAIRDNDSFGLVSKDHFFGEGGN